MAKSERDEIADRMGKAWKPLVDAFGPAADNDSAELSLRWGKGSADISDPGAVREALAHGCEQAWQIAESLAKEDSADTPPDSRLIYFVAAQQCQAAIAEVARAGMFKDALDAFSLSWGRASHAGRWRVAETLAALSRQAVDSPRHGSAELLSMGQRLDLLAAAPLWDSGVGQDIDGHGLFTRSDIERDWRRALADMGRVAALRPAMSPKIAELLRLSLLMWTPCRGNEEHFGRELGQDLGRMKIASGQLDGAYWSLLPFGVRLGVALSVSAGSKMGAWTLRRLLSEALAADDGCGPRRRELEDASAAVWCSFDRVAIGILEELAPQDPEEWARSGILRRFSAQASLSAGLAWLYGEQSLRSASAAWARKIVAAAGLATPERTAEGPRMWMTLVQALHSTRQAQEIKKVVAAASPASGNKRKSSTRLRM